MHPYFYNAFKINKNSFENSSREPIHRLGHNKVLHSGKLDIRPPDKIISDKHSSLLPWRRRKSIITFTPGLQGWMLQNFFIVFYDWVY